MKQVDREKATKPKNPASSGETSPLDKRIKGFKYHKPLRRLRLCNADAERLFDDGLYDRITEKFYRGKVDGVETKVIYDNVSGSVVLFAKEQKDLDRAYGRYDSVFIGGRRVFRKFIAV